MATVEMAYDLPRADFGAWLASNRDSASSLDSSETFILRDHTTSQLRTFCMRDMLEYMNDWIAKAAYYIWQKEGQPVGKDMEHWYRALQEFIETHS